MKKCKKLFSLIMAVLMVLSICPIVSFAEDDVLSYLTYEINDGEVTITGCDTSISGDVVIPDMIEGCPVTVIGESAFEYCDLMKSITIPDSVTIINNRAFGFCENLNSIKMSANLTHIGTEIFYNTAIYEDTSNWENDVLYVGDYLIESKLNAKEYVVKDGTKVIATGAFFVSPIEKIVIPESVSYINAVAFNYCSRLTEVVMPVSIKEIGDYCFSYCMSLEEIKLSDNIELIGTAAFYATGLRSVVIPASVTTINESLFEDCCQLTDVKIHENVESIGENAFRNCISLNSITLCRNDINIKEQSIGYTLYSTGDNLSEVVDLYKRGIFLNGEILITMLYGDWDDAQKLMDEAHEVADKLQNYHYETAQPNTNFTIYGYKSSTAETYANENGLKFVEICEHNYISGVIKEPTVTEVGIKADVCEFCGDIINAEEIPMLENDGDVSDDTNNTETPDDSESQDNSTKNFLEIIIQFFQKIIEFLKSLFMR